MSVTIWIGGEYENTGESGMVSDVVRTLREALEPLADTCHILCNFDIPGYPRPKGQEYVSNIDMAVLRNNQLVILELKNYRGTLSCSDGGTWYCDCGGDGRVEIKGGREGRTPHGQVCDYRNQMVSLLATNASRFLRPRKGPAFDFRRYVSGVIVFPASDSAQRDSVAFESDCGLWLKVLRLGGLAEAVCQFGGGRGVSLDDYEMSMFLERVLGLKQAQMVGDFPMVAADRPSDPAPAVKVVTVQVPVEVKVPVVCAVREEYGAISSVWNSDESVQEKTQQFAKLFKRFIWNKIRETYKDTAVKSVYSGIVNLFRGDAELLEHANRVRRLGNAMAEGTSVATAADMAETFKTLCLMVRKFYGQEIPEMLAEACGKIVYRDQARFSAPARMPLSIYAEVESVDAESRVLTCVSVGGCEDKVLKVRYGGDASDPSSGLADYLRAGDRVCLVTPIEDGEYLRASEIVLEPDYLISPQKLGGAYTYGKPEVYFWLSLFEDGAKKSKKIPSRSDPLTMEQYQLRGEFVNSSLADYCMGAVKEARVRMKEFFKDNPAELTAAAPGREWLQDCFAQDQNLKRFLGETVPREHGVPVGSWQVEAPLYSPVYGLSARADAISYASDGKSATVLELKSGKWDSFRGDRPKVEHAVQPIFYGDLLYFSRGMQRNAVNQLLCYSKTIPASRYDVEKQGRLFTRPELERVVTGGTIGRAMRSFADVRNRIVAMGEKVRSGEFRSIVESCRVTDFRTPAMGDTLWQGYKLPELSDLLLPLQSADELSKRYFYRQLSFIAEEEYLARLGERGADVGRGGSSALWRTKVAERQKAGLRLSELTVVGTAKDEMGRIAEIEFDMSRHPLNKGCSIRVGDSVCLYKSRGGEESIADSALFAANVRELHAKRVTVALADPQPESLFGFSQASVFIVEPAPSSYMSSGYSGLRYFLTGDVRRRELVLNRERPRTDPSVPLPIDEDEIARRYPGISDVLARAWRARDWFLLWGPPGTGKTSTAMRALVDMAMARPGMKVLLLAYTYRATDEICKMLEKRLQVAGMSNDVYLRMGNPLKCDPALRGRIADEMGFENRAALSDYVSKVRIVVAPVASAMPDKPLFSIFGHFDLAIVDEASQLLDTHILPLFCATGVEDNRPLVGKFVFIGDDRQLPAVVQQSERTSRVDDPMLRGQGIVDCRHSFFQRLRGIAGGRNASSDLCGLLGRQFRMHPTIAEFCNHFFYGDNLTNGDRPHQTSDLPPIPADCDWFERYTMGTRLGFYPIVNKSSESDAKLNDAEADLCSRLISVLVKRNACADSEGNRTPRPYRTDEIGVIVPFRNQIANVRDLLAKNLGEEAADGILVDTVERFQGSERPVIVFSTVIQNLYQSDMISARRFDAEDDDGDEDAVEMDRKLNVAVTRARERFYVVGNETVLRGLRAYGDLLDWISRRAGFYDPDVVF